MKYYNLTQGYGKKATSHKNVIALDFAGKDSGIDDIFAPFTGTIKKISSSANSVWLESNEEVLCADGIARYVVMKFTHANDISHLKVGQIIKQRENFYKEGTKGRATGNHVHLELGLGKFKDTGWYKTSSGEWQINNPLSPEKYMLLDNDVIIKNELYKGIKYSCKWSNEIEINPPNTLVYIVKKGDTLSKIARIYNTTWQKIYYDNKEIIGSNPNLIKIGIKLIIEY